MSQALQPPTKAFQLRRLRYMHKLAGRVFPLLFLLVALSAVQLKAQDSAAITGSVTDESGAVIPGAAVVLENPQTDAVYKTVSNAEGSYTFPQVKPGPGYKLSVSRDGFKPTVITGLYMNVNATRTQN